MVESVPFEGHFLEGLVTSFVCVMKSVLYYCVQVYKSCVDREKGVGRGRGHCAFRFEDSVGISQWYNKHNQGPRPC